MAKSKKVSVSQTKKKPIKTGYDCDDVEAYLDKAVNKIKNELLPKIENLDQRDKDQYEAAKKIMMDSATLARAKQEHVEEVVESVKTELEEIYESRKQMTAELMGSMQNIHEKLDIHIEDETNTFKQIQSTLEDISKHGTKLAQDIDNKLNNVQVNGGTYPFNEALKHMYGQHVETHNKLNEVITLVEPIQARRRWAVASRELIRKNGLLHFIFSTKIGAVIGTLSILLILNTILVDVFHVNFDLLSIFRWFATIFKAAN